MTDPAGNKYLFERDNSGKVTSMTDPLNQVTRFTYDPQFESIKTVTDPRGNTISFDYDSHANVVGVLYPDSQSESMSYDSGGTWSLPPRVTEIPYNIPTIPGAS